MKSSPKTDTSDKSAAAKPAQVKSAARPVTEPHAAGHGHRAIGIPAVAAAVRYQGGSNHRS
jgi:hypothetical protein